MNIAVSPAQKRVTGGRWRRITLRGKPRDQDANPESPFAQGGTPRASFIHGPPAWSWWADVVVGPAYDHPPARSWWADVLVGPAYE